MVGLDEPAEIAWEVEQALYDWIRAEKPVDAKPCWISSATAEAFTAWLQQLAEQGSLQAEGGAIVATARRLRGIAPPKPEAGAEAEAASSVPAAEESEEAFVAVGEHRLPAQLLQIFLDEAGQRLADLERYLQALN